MSAPRGFGLDVGAAAFGADGRTAVLHAPRRFDLLGVRDAPAGLQVRVRRRGRRWSPWVPVGPGHDHRPDTGSGAHASDPVWAGGAHELQLRAPRAPRGGLRVHFVAVGALAKRRGAAAVARAAKATSAQAAGPTIIPRAQWGGDSVHPRADPAYGDVQVAFVHHTVSANDYTPEESPSIVLAMAKYHRDTNGWNDLGYNFVVDKYGQIFEGRAGGIDQAVVGAQAQGYNSHSTGVANIGTYDAVGQTDVAIEAMSKLIAWKLMLHGVPVEGEVVLTSGGGPLNRYKSGTAVTLQRICGHRDGDATACPGDALYAQLPEIRRRAAILAPAFPVASTATAVAMDAPAAQVAYGQALELRGTLRHPDGAAVAGNRVQVQKQGVSGNWVTVARTTTDGDGNWAASVPWRAAGRVRARAPVPGAPAVVTRGADVGIVPVIAAGAKTTRVRAGRSVPLSGTVRPASAVVVSVEKQGSDGKFRRVGAVTVRARSGRFSTRVALRKPGLYRLTPQARAGKATATAAALYVRAVRRGQSLQSPSGGAGGAGAPAGTSPSPGGVAAGA